MHSVHHDRLGPEASYPWLFETLKVQIVMEFYPEYQKTVCLWGWLIQLQLQLEELTLEARVAVCSQGLHPLFG